MPMPFKQKLNQGEVLLGTIVSMPAPEVAEILRLVGFDWLFIDLEHSAMGIAEAQGHLQGATSDLPCLVRVPANEEAWIKKALDIGAAGIIAPNVRSARQAERIVGLCNYAPQGVRSVGIARAHGYGETFQAYVETANRDIAVVIQIEHIDAVAAVEEIVAVDGIDAVFIGPYDLSASMNKMGQTTHPKVQDAILTVKQCADRAGIPLGIFGPTAASVEPYIDDGYRLIAVGADALMIAGAARQILETLRKERKSKP